MSVFVFLAVAAAVPAGLTLEVRSPQETVLVGEPMRLTVTWRATRTMKDRLFPENESFTNDSLRFIVGRGSSEQVYREMPRSIEERIEPVVKLSAGQEVVRDLVLVRGFLDGTRPGFLFDSKGQYKLRVVYAKHDQRVESNVLTVSVTEPQGSDAIVLRAVRQDAAVLSLSGDAQSQERTRALVAAHPDSPLLRWARLRLIDERGMSLHNGQDPDTGELLRDLDDSMRRTRAVEAYRKLARAILEESQWGPFEQDALTLAYRLGQASGDEGLRLKARDELVHKFPRSEAVKRIKQNEAADEEEEEEEDEAP